jgi:hypothetical protein
MGSKYYLSFFHMIRSIFILGELRVKYFSTKECRADCTKRIQSWKQIILFGQWTSPNQINFVQDWIMDKFLYLKWIENIHLNLNKH